MAIVGCLDVAGRKCYFCVGCHCGGAFCCDDIDVCQFKGIVVPPSLLSSCWLSSSEGIAVAFVGCLALLDQGVTLCGLPLWWCLRRHRSMTVQGNGIIISTVELFAYLQGRIAVAFDGLGLDVAGRALRRCYFVMAETAAVVAVVTWT